MVQWSVLRSAWSPNSKDWDLLMGDVIQLEANETAASAGAQTQAGVADRVYKVVAPTGGTSHEDLYGFRSAIYELPPVEQKEADPKGTKSKRAAALLPILIILVLAALGFLLIPKMMKSNAPLQYVDLGTRRFDSAG